MPYTRPEASCSDVFSLKAQFSFFLFGLILVAGVVPAVADEQDVTLQQRIPGVAKAAATQQQGPAKSGGISVSSPNPYLSYLPVEIAPDYEGWRVVMSSTSERRRSDRLAQVRAAGIAQFTILQSEAEPVGVKGLNDVVGDAEAVPGFGTGAGDDPEADISGDLKTIAPPVAFAPLAEDEGDIGKASPTGLMSDDSKIAGGFIGDGAFGSTALTILPPGSDVEDDGELASANVTGVLADTAYFADGFIGAPAAQSSTGTGTGDFDIYRLDLVDVNTTLNIDLYDSNTGTFRPILGIYDAAGTLVGSFDDLSFPGSILLTADFGSGTWYIAVGGNLNFDGDSSDEFLTDPDDSDSGPGAGSEGEYALDIVSPVSGDFDFYRIDGLAGDVIDIEVDTDSYGGVLDPIVALYDASGLLLAFNDDGANEPGTEPFDSQLSFTLPSSGDFYVGVGGFSIFPTSPASFLADPFDSSSGPGFGSEGDYDITVSNNVRDTDTFSFSLEAGDIIAANVIGSAQVLILADAAGDILHGSFTDVAGIYPPSTALPGGGNTSMSYIVNDAGTYYLAVTNGEGAYTAELRAFRPPQEATGTKQKLFLDFDGETLDTTIWGPSGFPSATLSPMSAFLVDWGLAPGDESALIDAIIAEVEQALKTDISSNGLNPSFDIEILNSRDHADPFGDPDVSRVIIGGTIAESGIDTIGIAESIDVGNYDQSETALVLLDLLSDPNAANPNSLNSFAVDPGSTKIALVAAGVGNVTSHEAGHFFSNFHTDNSNSTLNLMDTGGNLPNLVGVGPDFTFGTGDDSNVVFETDDYDVGGGLFGSEDTKNSIAFSLTTGPDDSTGTDVTALADVSGDGTPDVAGFEPDDTGKPTLIIYSGANGATLSTFDYINDAWEGKGLSTVRDANQDGTADDPAVAMLTVNKTTGKIRVETRRADNGAFLGSIQFLNENWRAVDVVVVDDANGDGDTSDTLIAVLSERFSDGRIQLQLRDFDNGALISNVVYLNARWTPIAAAVADRSAMAPAGTLAPLIGVIAHEPNSGKRTMQVRVAGAGTFDGNIKFLGAAWDYHDVSVNPDANGDGTSDDPLWMVLATRASDDVIRVQSRLVIDGSFDDNVVILSAAWKAFRMDAGLDMGGNVSNEMVVTAIRRADNVRRIHVKDYNTGATTLNIAP